MGMASFGQVGPGIIAGLAMSGALTWATMNGYLGGRRLPSTFTKQWEMETAARNARKERESTDVPVALNPFRNHYPASFKNSEGL
eukprot:evm.model.scf_2709.1 EVM.evm.TU.scf_2709.1   scf_2709:1611-2638(+)